MRTSKIVAGHEPEKTNELLQLMGEIIEKNLDWKTALEQVISGKSARNESPRKPKDSSKKVTKDSTTKDRHKEKSKEKESKTKELKASKGTSSKTVTTTKRDEKPTMNKTKDKPITKSVTKERTSKGNKEPEKLLKRSTKETANSKSKLTKTESQSSKSSPSPNTQESTNNQKSIQNETECKHEEMPQQVENDKSATPLRKLSENNINNEISNTNEAPDTDNQQDSLQSSHLEEEKSKKSSAKKRKSSARKIGESFGETVQGNKINNLESDNVITSTQEKSEISEAEATTTSFKQELFASSVNQQQLLPKHSEPDTFKNSQPKAIPPPMQTEKQTPASPPVSLTSEIKRESTFTRENSKESSSNQSSLVNRPRTSLRPPSARPPSARPGAPRRRDKNIEIILQPNDRSLIFSYLSSSGVYSPAKHPVSRITYKNGEL